MLNVLKAIPLNKVEAENFKLYQRNTFWFKKEWNKPRESEPNGEKLFKKHQLFSNTSILVQ